MQTYIITQEYFDQYSNILTGSDFQVGVSCTQDEDGTLHLAGMSTSSASADSGDPVLPPPNPPILP